jgi:hypothetical protein
MNRRVYRIWKCMRTRCEYPSHSSYRNYGGRGITVDPNWQVFENFYADMGEPPAGHSIDRIDANGPYCKQNCRWADSATQASNRPRAGLLIEYRGKTQNVIGWCRELGLSRHLIKKMKASAGISYQAVFDQLSIQPPAAS